MTNKYYSYHLYLRTVPLRTQFCRCFNDINLRRCLIKSRLSHTFSNWFIPVSWMKLNFKDGRRESEAFVTLRRNNIPYWGRVVCCCTQQLLTISTPTNLMECLSFLLISLKTATSFVQKRYNYMKIYYRTNCKSKIFLLFQDP